MQLYTFMSLMIVLCFAAIVLIFFEVVSFLEKHRFKSALMVKLTDYPVRTYATGFVTSVLCGVALICLVAQFNISIQENGRVVKVSEYDLLETDQLKYLSLPNELYYVNEGKIEKFENQSNATFIVSEDEAKIIKEDKTWGFVKFSMYTVYLPEVDYLLYTAK